MKSWHMPFDQVRRGDFVYLFLLTLSHRVPLVLLYSLGFHLGHDIHCRPKARTIISSRLYLYLLSRWVGIRHGYQRLRGGS